MNANKPLIFAAVKAKDPCPNNEVIERGQASQWGGKKHKSFDILKEKISSYPTSALLDLHLPSKVKFFGLQDKPLYLFGILCIIPFVNIPTYASHVIGNFGNVVHLFWMRIMHVKGCVM